MPKSKSEILKIIQKQLILQLSKQIKSSFLFVQSFLLYLQMFKIAFTNSLKDNQDVVIEKFPEQEVLQANNLSKRLAAPAKKKIKTQAEGFLCKKKSLSNYQQMKFSEQSFTSKPLGKSNQEEVSILQSKNTKVQGSIDIRSSKLHKRGRRKQLKTKLKDVILIKKINRLKWNFIQKLRRNNVYSQHKEFQNKEYTQKLALSNVQGVEIAENISRILSTVFVINIIALLFIFTITIVFDQLRETRTIKLFQIVGLAIYLAQIILNLITVRFSLGRKLETLGQIAEDYTQESLAVDLINFLVMVLNSVTNSQFNLLNLCKIFMLFKLPHWFQKIKKLEVFFIQNYYKEQYWSLAKVFFFNFLYAHILSIILICMTNVSPKQNWITQKELENAQWYEKYVWSYYWSTTIMLTIGFGDITPHSYQEALIMIFIETISCVILAYNINCVGTLISNIRMQDEEKHRNLKVFKKLVQKNKVSEELNWKINNFIQEHSNIKKLTNIDEEAKFVENLPPNYKAQYLKQSNKIIFKGVYFFNSLMQKTLCALAEHIKAKITHPLEVLLSSETNFDLLILKDGEIGCKSNKIGNLSYNHFLINKVKVTQEDRPFLLHSNFITKQRSNYKIISTMYSLLYYLNFQNLVNILRDSQIDFQLYCQLKDKCMYHIDEFEVFLCKNCATKHTQFDCPKYHFMPLKQHIIHKELHSQKKSKNSRQKFERNKTTNEDIYSQFTIYSRSKNSFITSLQSLQVINSQNLLNRKARQYNCFLISKFLKQRKKTQNKKKTRQLKHPPSIQERIAQILKMHLSKMMSSQQVQDEVWIVEADKMKNYNKYFEKDNPQALEVKFSVQKRQLDNMTQHQIDFTQYKNTKTHSNVFQQLGEIGELRKNSKLIDMIFSQQA